MSTNSVTEASQNILNALSTLPNQVISRINLPDLQTALTSLAATVDPYLDPLTQLNQQALLSNTTWIAENLDGLATVLARLPSDVLARTLPGDLVQLVAAGAKRSDILTVTSPDLWYNVHNFKLSNELIFGIQDGSLRVDCCRHHEIFLLVSTTLVKT